MIHKLREIAEAAGRETLRFYGQKLKVDAKADHSPLTLADLASHRLIAARLAAEFPDIPVVSEEDEARPDVVVASKWFVVDPLDGTKEFIKQTGSFTVNIGLIEHGCPAAGVVHAPVQNITYGAAPDTGAWRMGTDRNIMPIRTKSAPDRLRIVASRDHAGIAVQALLSSFPDAECLSIGSSLKFCLVAEGSADIYLRDVPTMEWDTGAAQAIVESAGGRVLTQPESVRLTYGKPDFRNGSLLTVGDLKVLDRLFRGQFISKFGPKGDKSRWE